jgi:hypothetical protein
MAQVGTAGDYAQPDLCGYRRESFECILEALVRILARFPMSNPWMNKASRMYAGSSL